MVDIQFATAKIRRGKKKRRKKIEITGQKYNGLPYYIGRPSIGEAVAALQRSHMPWSSAVGRHNDNEMYTKDIITMALKIAR